MWYHKATASVRWMDSILPDVVWKKQLNELKQVKTLLSYEGCYLVESRRVKWKHHIALKSSARIFTICNIILGRHLRYNKSW